MRIKKRIPIILKALENKDNRKKLLYYWFTPPVGTQMEIGMPFYDIPEIEKMWDKHLDFLELKEFWYANSHLRLVQMLISLGYLQNYIGLYYYIEDDIAMIEANILKPEEILFWGQNYNEDGVLLAETNWILIKDMSTNHIKAILKDYVENKYDVSEYYVKIFIKVLNEREQQSKNN